MAIKFYLLNVFTEQIEGGNPLAICLLNQPLRTETMQAIAKQMNLSETIFIEQMKSNDDGENSEILAKVRIFTPVQELDFAGHPLVGTAFLLHRLGLLEERGTIVTKAGEVQIKREDDIFSIKTPAKATARESKLDRESAATMLGVAEEDIAAVPQWINTGIEQLIIPMSNATAIERATPVPSLFEKGAKLRENRIIAYLWYEHSGVAEARYFTMKNGVIMEDAATGSACANLGGYQLLEGKTPLKWRVNQGRSMGRPSQLYLEVTESNEIWIGGESVYVGKGELMWPIK